jgi:hypothetical protein
MITIVFLGLYISVGIKAYYHPSYEAHSVCMILFNSHLVCPADEPIIFLGRE